MYTDKQIVKYRRMKYIRELERFLNRVVSFFQKDDASRENFTKLRDRIFKPLEDIEKVELDSHYLIELERFVETTANLPESIKEMQEIRKWVLHQANRLQMVKRKKNKTKDKHRKKVIADEERHY
jgi:uncharacterized membrane protein YgaE (UPF0421/DUF939 family)